MGIGGNGMNKNINDRLNEIIRAEGSYVNHGSDKGGPTNWGITAATLGHWRGLGRAATEEEVNALEKSEARDIYRQRYVTGPGFDHVADVSPMIGWEVIDSGINFGQSVSATWLQRWLSGLNRQQRDYADLTIDGLVGRKTVAALTAFLNKRGVEGEEVLFMGLNCSQAARYLELGEIREKNEDFMYGWVRGRVLEQVKPL